MQWGNSFLERSVARMLDRVVIPEDLRRRKGRVMMHLSDTPSSFYRCLRRILEILDPPCILHTGDFVDEIKLEQTKRDVALYKKRVKDLVYVLRGGCTRDVFFVTGNHDLYDVVVQEAHGCVVLETGGTVTVCGKRVNAGHSFSDLPAGHCRFNFFGHDTTVPPERDDSLFFNGVLSMNFVGIQDDEIFTLNYPSYVQRERQRIRSMGL
ncbi:MAG: metallophosphoesterase [Thermovirgaceae bacterium]